MRVRHRGFVRTILNGAITLLAIGAGLICFQYPILKPVTRLSYDLPSKFKTRPTPGIVLVYLDEESAKRLNQPIDDAWNRSLHVSLLERLSAEGARLVFYDIVFDTPSSDPTQDEAFAAALQKFGHAVLGAGLDLSINQESGRNVDRQ